MEIFRRELKKYLGGFVWQWHDLYANDLKMERSKGLELQLLETFKIYGLEMA